MCKLFLLFEKECLLWLLKCILVLLLKKIKVAINVGDFSTIAKDEQVIMEDWTIDVEFSKMVDIILKKNVSIEEALKIMTRDEYSSACEEPNYKDYCERIAIGEFCGSYNEDNLPIYKKIIKDY